MLTLDTLESTKKKRKRVGRGGSRGGTSGRGHKGQNARSGGGVRPGFEGGQMPLYRRLPKRGFTNARFKAVVKAVNLEQLNNTVLQGETISKELLLEKGIVKVKKNQKFILKILGNGSIERPVTVIANLFSGTARKAIEDAGGKALIEKE
ncbi:50S ribosomal protein L15 [Candidatus Dependentiae bacterium]|nr:MAG: 50S ribosomal protein L15 [Candidatus Dependentiae bacterium]